VDLERVERLLRLFDGSRARELRVEAEGWRVAVRRGAGSAAGQPSPLAFGGLSSAAEPPALRVTAPLVGIFRQGEIRLSAGDRVRAGTPVGAIESMKILSPVFAQTDGRIEEVLVEDGHPVEYGEPLYLLQPVEEPDGEEEEEEEEER
jgi:acetyl-CoA carboxylase biotin carboxyl carrier protein